VASIERNSEVYWNADAGRGVRLIALPSSSFVCWLKIPEK